MASALPATDTPPVIRPSAPAVRPSAPAAGRRRAARPADGGPVAFAAGPSPASASLASASLAAADAGPSCQVCPVSCGIDRTTETRHGFCGVGRTARIASYGPDLAQEKCLSGWKGSGLLYFSGCNLRCVFCKEDEISHWGNGAERTAGDLAELMLRMQRNGAHNVHLVSPSHVLPQILESLDRARDLGLTVPVVYNSGGYDSVEALRRLEGRIDVYLPDFKLWSEERSARYLGRADYPRVAREALREMHRQVGDLVLGEDGLAIRGLLVRHLVMPNLLDETRAVLSFVAKEISPATMTHVMNGYRPAALVGRGRYSEIDRRLTRDEHCEALRIAEEVGLYRLVR
ncbi:MAG: radical SAM protein [Candidatus Eisenbacteria bacterium]